MKMKTFIRTAALLAVAAVATPAFAGGVTVAKDGDSKLKIGGKFFLNATDYKVTKNGATDTKTRSVAVDRAYFTAKYYFDKDWMMRITTDMVVDPNLKSKNSNILLKYAYVEGKLMGDAVVLRLGQSHTPWIDYEQGLWKHRYVSKVLVDTQGYDASSDLGIGLKGKLADGLVGYFVTATNGAGYSHPTTKKTAGSTVDFDSRVSFYPVKGLTLDFGYRTGYKGTKSLIGGVVGSNTKSTNYQVMASYGTHDYRIGANFINNIDKVDGSATNKTKEDAIALWGWGKFSDNLGAFGRYETTKDKLNANSASPQKEVRYVLGAEYFPRKNVTFSAVYDKTKFTNLGSVLGKTEQKTQFGLYSQVKF
ncbi:MAG: hypothetical protein Q9M21_06730 [Mariprofundaceae bacterium]|nr:hypothetical protein [Mariprofundaceae bacterium]